MTSMKNIEWLLDDARFLFSHARFSGALLTLLCAVQALSSTRSEKTDRQKFVAFLGERLSSHTGVGELRIQVKSPGRLPLLQEILYDYLRCPIIHEGKHLIRQEDADSSVCLDFSEGAPSVSSDGRKVTFGGRWLCNVLAGLVKDGLTDT